MAYIKNFSELAITPARADALAILESGLDSINTERIMRSKMKVESESLFIEDKELPLSNYKNIYFIGIGKCALEAGGIMEDILGKKITDGVIIDTNEGELDIIRTYTGSHPWPSEKNVIASKEVADLLNSATEEDLILTVISGGGSALLCLPYHSDCNTLIETTKALTKKGADIYELNTVRKHLSSIKGGQMAKMAHPAEVISLIFSDVLGDDISVIASGPTVKDETSVEDAKAILEKYKIEDTDFQLTETPKEDKWFEKVTNRLFVTNADAIEKMEEKAQELGYKTVPTERTVSGEAGDVGKSFAQSELQPGEVKIGGGETTVTITGSGKGGRNQETALSALLHLPEKAVFISAASDGIDNTDVAGAICDKSTMETADKLHLDLKEFISENDSYNFFTKVGDHIITGPTGSNVSDLYILLNYK
ncbi:MAG: glycerate kinase type-2 family protein [Patescibacteria group bacterium]